MRYSVRTKDMIKFRTDDPNKAIEELNKIHDSIRGLFYIEEVIAKGSRYRERAAIEYNQEKSRNLGGKR